MEKPEKIPLKDRINHWRANATEEQLRDYHAKRTAHQGEARRLFRNRMLREGRLEEWEALMRKYAGEGMTWPGAAHRARKDMGFGGLKKERIYQAAHEDLVHVEQVAGRKSKLAKRSYMAKKMTKLQEAIAALPARVPVAQEWDWVRIHPRMTDPDLYCDEEGKASSINEEDVFGTYVGKAPSQGAVATLKHYCVSEKRRDDFQKLIGSEDKKEINAGGASASAGGEVVSDDLSALQRFHDHFMATEGLGG